MSWPFYIQLKGKPGFFVMAPVPIMIVIEKYNGIVTEHRCKILIENPPAVIWLTYFSVSFYSSMVDRENNFNVWKNYNCIIRASKLKLRTQLKVTPSLVFMVPGDDITLMLAILVGFRKFIGLCHSSGG